MIGVTCTTTSWAHYVWFANMGCQSGRNPLQCECGMPKWSQSLFMWVL